ncbi:hypothetical protein LKI_08675 [Leuconostoc kimchii IMSNU 11154]|uniref:DUF1542 domain-containing protein n=1 Tax=Leuconostoc kimchii (strain IMSNU 11154 / KCTC 2386 / IH25) TaxID=762051 RepID=D5T5E4_LEUKI|nr:DUF1542 domain-containing protein [Leuconostoc kimchii]ADG41274.1 hypothetical protein LKI_08675 [Leuconostoc kimchii IMSNU 11154]
MFNKENNNSLKKNENKHYKLYKDVKFWVTALAGITFSVVSTFTSVSADTTTNQNDTKTSLIDTKVPSDLATDTQKQAAESAIDNEAGKITTSINNDSRLSQNEKNKQIQNVTNTATKVKNNVDQSTTSNDVNNTQSAGIINIDNQYVPGTGDVNQELDKNATNDDNQNKDETKSVMLVC